MRLTRGHGLRRPASPTPRLVPEARGTGHPHPGPCRTRLPCTSLRLAHHVQEWKGLKRRWLLPGAWAPLANSTTVSGAGSCPASRPSRAPGISRLHHPCPWRLSRQPQSSLGAPRGSGGSGERRLPVTRPGRNVLLGREGRGRHQPPLSSHRPGKVVLWSFRFRLRPAPKDCGRGGGRATGRDRRGRDERAAPRMGLSGPLEDGGGGDTRGNTWEVGARHRKSGSLSPKAVRLPSWAL